MNTIRLPTQRLLFDKIAITIPLDEYQRTRVLIRFNREKVYKQYRGSVYLESNQRYKNNYQLKIDKNNTVEISLYPLNPRHNFFRIEFNPNKLGKEGMVKLRRCLIDILGKDTVKQIFYKAKVTRLDLTLDVFDMEPNLFIQVDRVVTSKIILGKSGKIETQIVGSKRSECKVTMYDKNALRKKQGLSQIGGNYQRIECCLRNLQCSMHGLNASLLKHLTKVKFYRNRFLSDTRFNKRFRENAILFGLNYAFSKCGRNRRLRYRRYIQHYQIFPIEALDSVDFEKAHKRALGSLVHREYQQQFLDQAA